MGEHATPLGPQCMTRAVKLVGEAVTIFLINGVKLSGSVTQVLADGFILTRDGADQLIFSQAVATIMPQNPGLL